MTLTPNKINKLSYFIISFIVAFCLSTFIVNKNVKASDSSSPTDTQSSKSSQPILSIANEQISMPVWNPYLRELQHNVYRNWEPRGKFKDCPIVLNAKIDRDGKLLSLHLQKSSGGIEADKAAMAAVAVTAPFRALPAGYKNQDISVLFTFDNKYLNVTNYIDTIPSDLSTNTSSIPSSSNTNNYSTPTTSSANIDAAKSVSDWGPYMKSMQHKIKRNWKPPHEDETEKIVVMFKIAKDGKLLSLQLVKSSGNPNADRAALLAIETSAPFNTLPPEYKGKNLTIQFTFDYNVFNVTRKH